MTETTERYMGSSVLRKEDATLLTGQANFTDNIKVAGMLHMTVLRSPLAHAKIAHVDVSAALNLPGVVAAFTGKDLADEWAIGIPCGWPVTEDIKIPDHWPLAKDEVNHMGEAVAVVLATDRYKAQDALEHIEVDYEPLDVVVDVEAALEEGSPLAHEEFGTNECYVWPLGTGDVNEAFEKADVVVSERYIQQRLIPSAIEPRATVVMREPASAASTFLDPAASVSTASTASELSTRSPGFRAPDLSLDRSRPFPLLIRPPPHSREPCASSTPAPS